MKFTTPPGVFDIYPDPIEKWKSSSLWQLLERTIYDICCVYDFQEIRTPLLEHTELFVKGTGTETDIVTKEMYTLVDKGNRSLTLRPEGTPSVLRAIAEHHLTEKTPIQKLFYIGPMFRYERQQAGRYRQHHQFGVEVVGLKQPEQDAELIDMLLALYKAVGIKDPVVQLNSLGSQKTRTAFRDALRSFLEPHLAALSDDSRRRFKTNPLRILDSKDPSDIAIVENAPSILDFLDEESQEHFDAVRRRLDQLNLPYVVQPRLVRGLDYYNKTVFEVTSSSVGLSLGGGGRYDGLLKNLGGPDLPGIGFATGMERIIQAMVAQQPELTTRSGPTITLIALGDAANERCLQLLQQLRFNGVSAVMDYSSRKIGKAMRYANSINSLYTLVVGDTELSSEEITIKEMTSGQKVSLTWSSLPGWLRTRQGVPTDASIPCGGIAPDSQPAPKNSLGEMMHSLLGSNNTAFEETFQKFQEENGEKFDLSNVLGNLLKVFIKQSPSEEQKNKNNSLSDDPSKN